MKARVLKQSEQIRKFKVSAKLNFAASEYFEMIDWTNVVIIKPPVIKNMTDANIQEFIAMQVTPTSGTIRNYQRGMAIKVKKLFLDTQFLQR